MIRRVAFMIAFFRESLPRDRAYSPVRHSGVHTTGKGQTRLDIPNVGLLHAQVPTVHMLSAPFFLFFRIHSVVFLFSESNFLSAPPPSTPHLPTSLFPCSSTVELILFSDGQFPGLSFILSVDKPWYL